MNRTIQFIKNSFLMAIFQLLTMIAGFIIPKIILKYYNSDINGVVTSITQFINYFLLVEAGLAAAAIYSLYKPLAEKNQKEINVIVSTAKRFYNKSGFLFLILVLVLAILFPIFTKSTSLTNFEVFFLVIILGASGILEFFTLGKYRVLLTADQKIYVISFASIIYLILNTLIIMLLGSLQINIVLVRGIAITSIFVRSLILHLYVKKKYPEVKYNEKTDNSKLDKRWDALYLQILGAVQNGAPIVILTFIKDFLIVSIYSIYNLVLAGINSILGIFISGLSSSFGDIIARKEIDTLQKSYNEFEYAYYNIITFCYTLTFILIVPFVKIYTKGITDTNYILPLTGFLFTLNGLVYNLKTPQGMQVISAGMYKETRVQSTIQALIIIVLGIPLTILFGINGVIISSILSNLYRSIDLFIFVPKHITHLSIKTTIFRAIKTIIVSLLILLMSLKLSSFQIINIKTWIFNALFYGAITLVILLIIDLIFERKTINNIINRFKRLRS